MTEETKIRVTSEPVVDPVTSVPAVTVGRTYAAELDSPEPGWALITGDDGEEEVLGPGEFEVVEVALDGSDSSEGLVWNGLVWTEDDHTPPNDDDEAAVSSEGFPSLQGFPKLGSFPPLTR